jgi:hypothetical protein
MSRLRGARARAAANGPHAQPQFYGYIRVHLSAKATFYAPSDLAGRNGMHREVIRSTPRWYGQYTRRDTVLVKTGRDADLMGGMRVGRVLRFISFDHEGTPHTCAVVEWFDAVGNEPDALTGMWKLAPAMGCGIRLIDVVHLDSIVRSCHLIPAYSGVWLPRDFHRSQSLVTFPVFYLNHYSDYHAFETFPRAPVLV